MTDQSHAERFVPVAVTATGSKPAPSVPEKQLPLNAEASGTAEALGQPPPVNKLTPEEQMALFEKELKEKDWGHQPC